MKYIFAILLLCCAASSTAQLMPPDSRMGVVFSPELLALARVNAFEPLAPRTAFVIEKTSPVEVKPRIFNRTFAILAAVSAAATVADVELTANCLKTSVNCHEANPLLGKDPSRARLYGVNVPIYAGEMMLSRVLRRKERQTWMTPLASLTGMHAVGAASNLWARDEFIPFSKGYANDYLPRLGRSNRTIAALHSSADIIVHCPSCKSTGFVGERCCDDISHAV